MPGHTTPPSNKDIWCVRIELVEQASFASNSVWDSKGPGSVAKVSIWEIPPKESKEPRPNYIFLGTIRASQNYDAPDSSLAKVVKPKDFIF
ncbi:hypothetical protein GGI43DRAFT_431308 [Trichoderma evansii]